MAPVRLHKVDHDNSPKGRFEAWCVRHTGICLLVCFILFSILFVVLIYALVGVSATESGTVYNQFQNII